MGNRIADNIRRIVWNTIVNEWGGKAGTQADLINDRDSLPSKRGVGFQDNPEISGNGSGTPGKDDKVDPDRNEVYNPLGTTRIGSGGASSGSASAADIIDGASNLGSSITDALEEMGGMTEPTSGTPMKLNFYDLHDYIPEGYDPVTSEWNPEWTDPEEPPDIPWDSGIYWYMNVSGYVSNPTFHGTTPQTIVSAAATLYLDVAVSAQAPWTFLEWAQQGTSTWIANFQDKNASGVAAQVSFRRNSCTPGSAAACPITQPKAEEWPSDGSIGLKITNDKIEASGFDPDKPLNLSDDQSKVEFNFGSGRSGAVEKTADGDTVVYETTAVGGDATGDVQKYNASGVKVGTFPASELPFYLPPS